MRTTLDLPDALFRQAKAVALERGTTLKALFSEILNRSLNEMERRSQRMEAPPVRKESAKQIPARSNADLQGMLESEELQKLE